MSIMQSISNSQRNVENPSPKLVLYSYWESSCAWRVRFALKLKGLPYEYKAVDLSKGEHFSPEFERLNPLHYVPVLVDGDMVISDSFAILLYLEEKYPQKTLLPEDPRQRALNMQAASIVSSSIQPFHMGSMLKYIQENVGPEASFSWAQSSIEKGFVTLEKLLQDVASNYATGETLFMADVFLAPEIAVAETRFKMDMTKFPTLGRIFESYKALLEFAASLPSAQPDAVL